MKICKNCNEVIDTFDYSEWAGRFCHNTCDLDPNRLGLSSNSEEMKICKNCNEVIDTFDYSEWADRFCHNTCDLDPNKLGLSSNSENMKRG